MLIRFNQMLRRTKSDNRKNNYFNSKSDIDQLNFEEDNFSLCFKRLIATFVFAVFLVSSAGAVNYVAGELIQSAGSACSATSGYADASSPTFIDGDGNGVRHCVWMRELINGESYVTSSLLYRAIDSPNCPVVSGSQAVDGGFFKDTNSAHTLIKLCVYKTNAVNGATLSKNVKIAQDCGTYTQTSAPLSGLGLAHCNEFEVLSIPTTPPPTTPPTSTCSLSNAKWYDSEGLLLSSISDWQEGDVAYLTTEGNVNACVNKRVEFKLFEDKPLVLGQDVLVFSSSDLMFDDSGKFFASISWPIATLEGDADIYFKANIEGEQTFVKSGNIRLSGLGEEESGCNLENARWYYQNGQPVLGGRINDWHEGDSLYLTVKGDAESCVDKNIEFKLYDDEPFFLGEDILVFSSSDLMFSDSDGIFASAEWPIESLDDGLVGGDADLYFMANIEGEEESVKSGTIRLGEMAEDEEELVCADDDDCEEGEFCQDNECLAEEEEEVCLIDAKWANTGVDGEPSEVFGGHGEIPGQSVFLEARIRTTDNCEERIDDVEFEVYRIPEDGEDEFVKTFTKTARSSIVSAEWTDLMWVDDDAGVGEANPTYYFIARTDGEEETSGDLEVIKAEEAVGGCERSESSNSGAELDSVVNDIIIPAAIGLGIMIALGGGGGGGIAGSIGGVLLKALMAFLGGAI